LPHTHTHTHTHTDRIYFYNNSLTHIKIPQVERKRRVEREKTERKWGKLERISMKEERFSLN
jgi:hypothetical protein